MNNPALYNETNILPKRDALLFLQEFGPNIKWKYSGERIIDIGCGDGSVTVDILTKFLPPNDRKIVACDISEQMVKFCKENYSKHDIEFIILNIEGQLPEIMQNNFDHAVSFYALHWIRDQDKSFKNIYELLTVGGSCWLMFLGHMPLYDTWRRLARMDKWRPWLKDVERFIGAYHDVEEPEKKINEIMQKIGFTNIDVIRKRSLIFTYKNVDMFKKAVSALTPFKIPKEIFDTYLDDIVNELRCINRENVHNKGLINETYHYELLIVNGRK